MKPETLTPIFPVFAVVRVGSAVSFAERVNDDAALSAVKVRASALPGATVETVSVESVQLKMADMANASALLFMSTLLSSISDMMAYPPPSFRKPRRYGHMVGMGLGKTASAFGTALHSALAGEPLMVGKFPNDQFGGVQFGGVQFGSKEESLVGKIAGWPELNPVFKQHGAFYGSKNLPTGVFHGLSHKKGCGNPECLNCGKNKVEPGAPFEGVKTLMPEGSFFLVEAKHGTTVATSLHSTPHDSRAAALAAAYALPRLPQGENYVILKGTGKF